MNILMLSVVASPVMVEKLRVLNPAKYSVQGQLFMNNLIQGLKIKDRVSLDILSKYSLRLDVENKKFITRSKEIYKNQIYNYTADSVYFSTMISILSALKFIFNWKNKKKEQVILVDGLSLPMLVCSMLAKYLLRMKVATFVTDMPRFMFSGSFIRCSLARIINLFLTKMDFFIVLTEKMNEELNIYNKPYIVIDGLINMDAFDTNTIIDRRKVCVYAGSVNKIYGIDKLIQSFIKLNNKDFTLEIYGNGDYINEMQILIKDIPNIKYCGCVSNAEIKSIEQNAYLLINPRPSEDEYTMYSFPSKTLEYMLSGTPVLTTHLPCINKEYDEYLNYFENERVDGFCSTLRKILELDSKILFRKASLAREYVIINKNVEYQGLSIVKKIELI